MDLQRLESETAGYVVQGLNAFVNDHPDVKLTNALQLFEYATTNSGIWGYPHWLEREFKRFGKRAGFTNSIFEKYLAAPPGIQISWPKGELVLLSTPYKNRDGQLTRTVIVWTGKHYEWYKLGETTIQGLFQRANLKIPAPTHVPPSPRAPAPPARTHFPGEPPEWVTSVDLFFGRVTEKLGWGWRYGRVLRNIVFGIVMIGGIAAIIFLARHVRRQ